MKRLRGFNSIEAMIVLLIVGLGLLSLSQVQATLHDRAELIRQRADALSLAHREVESWRAEVRSRGRETDLPAGFEPPRFTAGIATRVPLELTRRVSSADLPSLARLDVRVAWVDRRGQTQSVVLSTLAAWTDPGASARWILQAP